MIVPSLSPSGSWFEPGWYTRPTELTPFTVHVTDRRFFRIEGLVTLHVPAAPVVQDDEPLASPLQEPVTNAPATAECWAVWTEMVTVTLQSLPRLLLEPSRSPT